MDLKHFRDHEFQCKCGCGLENVKQQLKKRLDAAREACGFPFIITSASRCKYWNERSGGKHNSSHLDGNACDIACDNAYARFKMVRALMNQGICRFGIAKDFLHVDLDMQKPQNVIWLYP